MRSCPSGTFLDEKKKIYSIDGEGLGDIMMGKDMHNEIGALQEAMAQPGG
jgi:hypothetical protein